MISGISDRGVFTRLRSDGLHVRSKDLRVRYLLDDVDDGEPDAERTVQIAYSISRKVGNAVIRNRLRRRLRELFNESLETSSVSFSAAMVIVLPGAAALNFAELREQVWEIMQKIEKSGVVQA